MWLILDLQWHYCDTNQLKFYQNSQNLILVIQSSEKFGSESLTTGFLVFFFHICITFIIVCCYNFSSFFFLSCFWIYTEEDLPLQPWIINNVKVNYCHLLVKMENVIQWLMARIFYCLWKTYFKNNSRKLRDQIIYMHICIVHGQIQ